MKRTGVYFSFAIVLFIFSCQDKLAYQVGNSMSISDSKKRGAFCMECKVVFKPDSIREYYDFYFKEIFLEKIWNYGRTQNVTYYDTTNKDKYHFICVYEDNYSYPYPIEIFADSHNKIRHHLVLNQRTKGFLNSGAFKLSAFIDDTLTFNIYKIATNGGYIKNGEIKFYCKDLDSILKSTHKNPRDYR
jgi:hypothetical protein